MNNSIKKPNLFLVGAAKSGTTSLYQLLKQHPDIYFPDTELYPKAIHSMKEPKYFSHKYHEYPHTGPGDIEATDKVTVKDIETYLHYYDKSKDEKYLGDASAAYLYHYQTAKDIFAFNENAKIIISLRNPIDRAYSAYTHKRTAVREVLSFEDALKEEENRLNQNYAYLWGYKKVSLYYDSVKFYIETFGCENVHIVLFDNMKKNMDKVLHEICGFLDIEDYSFDNVNVVYNSSGIPQKNLKTLLFYKAITMPNILKKSLRNVISKKLQEKLRNKFWMEQLTKETISLETKKYLKGYFEEDIKKLSKLLNIDLSNWLNID